MIEPVLKDHSLLRDIDLAIPPDDGIAIWWLGQSGYVIKYDRKIIYIDPYLSESLTDKYANSSKPHVRMISNPLKPYLVHHADWILCTHKHSDHMDPQTLLPMMQTSVKARCVIPASHYQHAIQMGLPKERLLCVNADQTLALDDNIQLLPIPAAHESLETDKEGNHLYLGYILILGRFTLYHSGDTIPYRGLMQRLTKQRIDLALLPVNGRDAQRHTLGTLGNCTVEEALTLATLCGAAILVPNHYDMFTFNTIDINIFIKSQRELHPEQRSIVMRTGERHIICSGTPHEPWARG